MFTLAVSRRIAVALGIAAVVAALLIVWRTGLFGGGGTSGLGSIAEAGEITHIRASITTVEADGTATVAGSEETWTDTAGTLVRIEERDATGEVDTIIVRKGNELRELDLSEEGAPHFRVESYLDAQNEWLAAQVGGPLYFRDFFRGPTAETIGETEVDGRSALVVRVPPPETGENPRPVEGVVDKETGWPFEIRLFSANETGGFDFVGKSVIKYELVESLALDSALNLFELEAPGGDASSYGEMSVADAKAFTAFPLLYLGDSFDGMALDTITVVGSSAPGLHPSTQQVFFIYVEWAAEGPKRPVRQLDVVMMAGGAIPGDAREPREDQEPVATAKGPGLFSAQNSSLEIEMEGAFVVIRGDGIGREEVLKAAEALVVVNPGAAAPSAATATATAVPSPTVYATPAPSPSARP